MAAFSALKGVAKAKKAIKPTLPIDKAVGGLGELSVPAKVEEIPAVMVKPEMGGLSGKDLTVEETDNFIDTSPDDFAPEGPRHDAADTPYVDYLKDEVGFSHVDTGVKGNSLRVYSEAFDQLYDLLPLAKGTSRNVLSLRGRLSAMPMTKEATGTDYSLATRGAFSNIVNGDEPRMFMRAAGKEGSSDYYEKVRVVQHEWFHALDDYLLGHFSESHKWNQVSGRITQAGTEEEIRALNNAASSDGAKLSGMRPELFEKWERLRTAITTKAEGGRNNMAGRIAQSDLGNKDYLQNNWEMMSRSFEQYMEMKDSAKFGEPPALSRGIHYPYADEMKILEPLFDDFFAELKVKQVRDRNRKPVPTWYGVAGAVGAAASPDEAEAGVLDDIAKLREAQSQAAGLSDGDGQAVPPPEPQEEEAPPIGQWTDEQKERYIDESGIDETPSAFWNRELI